MGKVYSVTTNKVTDKELESLSELCSQPPILKFEGFIIRPYDGWHLWFENPQGEGTTIRKAHFLNVIATLFEKVLKYTK